MDPCGPFGPAPPNSRLSSLLWQSVQKMRIPTKRADCVPFSFNIFVSKLGCGNGLVRSCTTGWLDVAFGLNCGTKFSGSPTKTKRVGEYPYLISTCLPTLDPWQRKQFSY